MVRNSAMAEPTFYEESSLYGSPNANRICAGPGNPLGSMKRSNLTLDLNNRQGPQSKRPKLGQLQPMSMSLTPILASPDLLKLGSPEFEKLLSVQEGLVTTMPTPTSNIYFGEKATLEQEQYARGFVDALNELHHSDSSQEPGSLSGGGVIYTNLEPPGSVQSNESMMSQGMLPVKDEPQTVPSVSSSPPMSPIDMESQERIKLERKRQRNRVAASKCRRRKLERISRLEDKVRLLKGENNDLSQMVNRLRDHVCKLKEQVIEHMKFGCHINNQIF